jgi:hypothetical protein
VVLSEVMHMHDADKVNPEIESIAHKDEYNNYRVCCSANGFVSCYANTFMFQLHMTLYSIYTLKPVKYQHAGQKYEVYEPMFDESVQPQNLANVFEYLTVLQGYNTQKPPEFCGLVGWVCNLATLGQLNICSLEIFLGYASPCLMDLFAPQI